MPDIISIGEMLIDFTESTLENGDIIYKKNAGGSPANVAVMASKLGVSSGFIGKVGKDMFGLYLKQILTDNNVNTKGLIVDSSFSTALAFVGRDENGAREFVFYRKNCADSNLNFNEVNLKLIDECKVLHFGSFVLTGEPSKTAVLTTVEYAKKHGKIISYDPKWRENVWGSKEEAMRTMSSVLGLVDIIKVSEDELQILTDSGNMLPAIAKLLNTGVKIICITQGAKGCIIATRQGIETIKTFKVETVDTLGAGDSFFGAFLSQIVKSGKPLEALDMEDLKGFGLYANACGSLSSTKEGAIPAMPADEEICKLINEGIVLQ